MVLDAGPRYHGAVVQPHYATSAVDSAALLGYTCQGDTAGGSADQLVGEHITDDAHCTEALEETELWPDDFTSEEEWEEWEEEEEQ